jgi:hypothetical protein
MPEPPTQEELDTLFGSDPQEEIGAEEDPDFVGPPAAGPGGPMPIFPARPKRRKPEDELTEEDLEVMPPAASI